MRKFNKHKISLLHWKKKDDYVYKLLKKKLKYKEYIHRY